MQRKSELLEAAGKKVVFLGNEAIARGALEAGVGIVAVYPGKPSSEVGASLALVAKEAGIYYEWSTNEKVATEVAAGAAFCGVRSLTAMKHFGLNVASDSLLPIAYVGVKGGMVVIVGDDPKGHSSAQSEEDTRYLAKMGYLPVIEPSTMKECKDFTIKAFEISEKYSIPVILRITTMIGHATGTIELGTIRRPAREGSFKKNKNTFMNMSPQLQVLHARLLKKMEGIEKEYSKLNRIEGKGKIGIIASGASYNYVKEINPKNVKIAKLNVTNPISKKFISRFLKGLKTVVVVEELEPFVEDFVKEVAFEEKAKAKIYGKNILPRVGEFNQDIVACALAKAGVKVKIPNIHKKINETSKIKIPVRYPDFCKGCPHLFTFDNLKTALGPDTIWAGDVGCYAMGLFDPYNMQDFMIAMGASQGISHGIKKVSKQKIVAFIGDSTFFHAGMPGLANIVYNKSNPLVIIMDNSITAMTGHQPNPGTGFNATWQSTEAIKIEDVVRGLGVKNIAVIDPIEKEKMIAKAKEFIEKDEPSVIISRRMCVLYKKKAINAGLIKLGNGEKKDGNG